MKKAALKYFENLCNASGPTGFEAEPIRLAREYVKGACDDVLSDKLGSVIFRKKGPKNGPVVLLPGHADEIGFIVSGIHKSGFLNFNPLGGWPDQVLLAQRVRVMTRGGQVPGVVASKPPHLMSSDERTKLVKKEKMFIDVGASNEDEAREMGIRVGDAIVPESRFALIEKTVYKDGKKQKGKASIAMGKAFDNRAGLYVATEVLRRLSAEKIAHPNTVLAAATVQEEVGLRGAGTAGYKVEPDVCIAVDVDIAGDVPGIEPHEAPGKMGGGVTICTYDRSMIPNQKLKDLAIDTAEAEKIPYALTSMAGGGQDAGAVQRQREGCPALYLGVPTRHIHSHVGLLDLADLEHTVDLAIAMIKRLDAKTVQDFVEF